MTAFIITYISVVSLCTVVAIVIAFSPYLPMIVENESWKVWKQCYNDDNFIKTFECEYGVRYDWTDTDYYAIVYGKDNMARASILSKSRLGEDRTVFCSYYIWHSKKLAKKLMTSNKF